MRGLSICAGCGRPWSGRVDSEVSVLLAQRFWKMPRGGSMFPGGGASRL